MPSLVEMNVGSSNRLRLNATHGPTTSTAPDGHHRDRLRAARPTSSLAPRAQQREARAAARAGSARPAPARRRRTRSPSASAVRSDARPSASRNVSSSAPTTASDRERLAHDQAVVHPEVRVERGDARGDEPGACRPRAAGPAAPSARCRARPIEQHLEPHDELGGRLREADRVAGRDRPGGSRRP